VIGIGAGTLIEWRYRQTHSPFAGVELRKDVVYVTGRKWPIVEDVPAGPLLRWLKQEGNSIALEPRPPLDALSTGSDITVLVHGFHSAEEDVATYFGGLIDHLRSQPEYPGTLVMFDWPSIAVRHGPEVEFVRGLNCEGQCRGGMADLIFPPNARWEAGQYKLDRSMAADDGVPGLAALIKLLRSEYRDASINIVAHSMGAWVTLECLRRHELGPLARIVLLAPDVPQDWLDDATLRQALAHVGRLHVFYSSADEILPYSKLINGTPILGLNGPTKSEYPANVLFHDATDLLGNKGVHGSFVTRDGAAALFLRSFLVDPSHRQLP
jgi:pimeloyl-ACP methyl ester carboxylesterase